MTQIGQHIAPVGRPGILGVHSMDSFNMAVPNLKEARRFYTNFGLDVRESGQGLALHTFGHSHLWGHLHEVPRKSLGHLSFGIFEQDMKPFRDRLQACGRRTDRPANALRKQRHLVQGSERPSGSSFGSPRNPPPNGKSSVRAYRCRRRPARRPDPRHHRRHTASAGWRTSWSSCAMWRSRSRSTAGVLGMRLSDESGGVVAFMHGIHGSDHHMVAFAKSEAPGLHHCSWDVPSVQAIGFGRHAHGRQRLQQGLGPRAARAWLQLLPLRPRSVGQLQRVFLRHRLHPGRNGLGGAGPIPSRTASTCGAPSRPRTSRSITRRQSRRRNCQPPPASEPHPE